MLSISVAFAAVFALIMSPWILPTVPIAILLLKLSARWEIPIWFEELALRIEQRAIAIVLKNGANQSIDSTGAGQPAPATPVKR